MLKNWKDSVGAKVTSQVNDGIKNYNKALNDANQSIVEINRKLTMEFKVKFNKKRILSLQAKA